MSTPAALTTAHTIVRVAIGGILFAHGAQKLFGMFGGHGPEGTGQFFESVGIKPGREAAIAAGLGEAGGGLALITGFVTPVGAAAAAATMGVAASQHAPNGFFNEKGGIELPATLGLIASTFLISGPGAASLDSATGNLFNKPWMRIVAALTIVPAIVTVVVRQRREKAAADAEGSSDAS
ncbi:DoxX family protein [Marisediminicola senii]|uniref:DoxX family protein n=1 Tax=Marisediminicola senii TaxID=2711233 RepID=UPI0013ED9B9C|nr:DoxX family protein [Marisediminicola senii]